MKTSFTIEEAAALIANKYGWNEGAQKTLQEQLLDAAKEGMLVPYRPKQCNWYYQKIGVRDLNVYFEAAGAPWQLDNDGETATDSPFETEYWNQFQVLAWVYLGEGGKLWHVFVSFWKTTRGGRWQALNHGSMNWAGSWAICTRLRGG